MNLAKFHEQRNNQRTSNCQKLASQRKQLITQIQRALPVDIQLVSAEPYDAIMNVFGLRRDGCVERSIYIHLEDSTQTIERHIQRVINLFK